MTPAAGQSFAISTDIMIAADAADADGTIARVDFYRGSTLIGTVSSAPYTVIWNNAAAGTYSLTAKATDDKGASTTSAARTIKVEGSVVAREIYYIHADHLNTPRLITNKQNQAVWRNGPLTEPFGTSTPEEDPRNTGTRFEFNLRFPGQYYDKETATHYNYYRDYNPQTGRYLQSDPIGLLGGSNTYLYVEANPLIYIDPEGLQSIAACANPANAAACAEAGIGMAARPVSIPRIFRDIWWPDRTSGQWSCKARADCNDNIPGNCPEDPAKRFAFGGGVANDLGIARDIAKSNATSNLQCQPKHVSCKCTGPKGEQYSGGC